MTTHHSDVPVLDTYQAVVSAFSEFLTVAIHTILYERNIYPQTSFISARKYNYPVKQSRHPKVCKWIQDAVAAVEVEMLKCTIATTSVLIHSPPPTCNPLERYLFSTASFPLIPPSELLTPFSSPPTTADTDNKNPITTTPLPHPPPPTQDLPEHFRATISRLTHLSNTLSPLPENCSFTLVVELRDSTPEHMVDPPIGHPQKWIAAEVGLQKGGVEGGDEVMEGGSGVGEEGKGEEKGGREGGNIRKDLGGVRTTPVRAVEAGAFKMEVWVEEGSGKVELEEEAERTGLGDEK